VLLVIVFALACSRDKSMNPLEHESGDKALVKIKRTCSPIPHPMQFL